MMRVITFFAVYGPIALVSSLVAPAAPGPRTVRYVPESVSSNDPSSCNVSLTAVNTTLRLTQLRQLMTEKGIAAYVITGSDAHGSEYTAAHDNRRGWISGFTGSAGEAVVTLDSAALWTDSRYYLQALQQMDCNWQLMRRESKEVPIIPKWLDEHLANGSFVGADPSILTNTEWKFLESYLSERGKKMKPIETNLVDVIWGAEQPDYPNDPITVLPDEYAGESWPSKTRRLQEAISKLGADYAVLTALDDAAWLFNLRSSEVAYTPVFRAYVVVPAVSSSTGQPVRLYLPEKKISPEVRSHLQDQRVRVEILAYDQIWSDLPKLAKNATKIILPSPAYMVGGASYRLFTSVPADKVKWTESPVIALRNRKNPVEAAGMEKSHIRDAVALCQILALLEKEVSEGVYWDELSVAKRLAEFRAAQNLSRGDSFEYVVAFGPHSAFPHYSPSNDTNVQITKDILMIDSGGQYLDGTTDVTRTIHLGSPTALQVDVYTRLLRGCAALASLIFPAGKTYSSLEVLLRAPLYQLGLNYGHGSTHGIGAYLSVHEGFESEYQENFFGSHEPGYYKENQFGMRLENIVRVVPAKTKFDTGTKFLTFNTTTLVPYEPKLINTTQMTDQEIDWVNQYYEKIRRLVGEEMIQQGLDSTYAWLLKKTEPIKKY